MPQGSETAILALRIGLARALRATGEGYGGLERGRRRGCLRGGARGCKANGAGIATDPTLTGRGLRTTLRLATVPFEELGLQCPVLRLRHLAIAFAPDCLTGARTGIRFLSVQRLAGVTCVQPASRGTRQVPMLCVPYGMVSAASSAGLSPEFATALKPELPALGLGYRKTFKQSDCFRPKPSACIPQVLRGQHPLSRLSSKTLRSQAIKPWIEVPFRSLDA